jgi:hypothetical protein
LTKEQSNQQSFIKKLEENISVFSSSINFAECGASNIQIASTLYREIKRLDTKDCFIFVGWTTFGRNAHWHNEFQQYRTYPENKHKDSIEKLFFDTESSILFVENLLSKLGIPYCMIQAFHDHADDDFLVGKRHFIKNWINWNKPNNTLFDICAERYLSNEVYADSKIYHRDRNFKNRFIAECRHPSREGHIKIAQTLQPYLQHSIDTSTN